MKKDSKKKQFISKAREKDIIEKIEVNKQKEEIIDGDEFERLRKEIDENLNTEGFTVQELYINAENNHLWALGAEDEKEALRFEITADICRQRAQILEAEEQTKKQRGRK